MRGTLVVVVSFAMWGCNGSTAPERGDASGLGTGGASEAGLPLQNGSGGVGGNGGLKGSGGVSGSGGLNGSGGEGALGDSATCSPPPSTPAHQALPGEVATVALRCGEADGGAPRRVGLVPAATVIAFDVGLPLRNQSTLNEYLNEISDPTSPHYRQYLTPDEITSRFGPTVCDYEALRAWGVRQGFTIVQTYADRLLTSMTGTAATIDAAFHVTLGYYQREDGTQFYAPDVDPWMDLNVPVLAVDGLDTCAVPTSNANDHLK
jgi:hypothetical protein